ncbi:zinc finger MYM-type protein 1-like protein [Tanacetum coccineum]
MDGFLVRTKKNNNSVAENNDKVNVNIDNENAINNENLENDEVNANYDNENHMNNENVENDEVNANDDIENIINNGNLDNDEDGLDSNIKELLVSKGAVRETNINYPTDRFGRHFSCEHYVLPQKRWSVLLEYVDELTVKSLCATRWESHVDNVKAIKTQLSQIKEAQISLSLVIWKSGFENAFYQSEQIAEFIGVEHEFLVKRAPYDTNLKECCLNLEFVLTHDKDCDIDGNDLFMELQILYDMLPKGASDGERPWTSIQIMEFTNKMDMFMNVLLAYKILLTILVTTTSAERSFSKLKILKSYLQSTISQERLDGLAIVSIESNFLANLVYDKLTDVFASRNTRRHRFR